MECDICGASPDAVPVSCGENLCQSCLNRWWAWARENIPSADRTMRDNALLHYIHMAREETQKRK